ncbi:MAG: type II toxin-antitoxin system HicA family toxin [Paludibacteraceae bacterium]|nr:type II toxin-antitoxin system HicA family toxin [Paludibacteraceae bacterium]
MRTSEFLRLLKKNGIDIVFVKHGGEHDHYYYKAKNQVLIIPRHPSEEIKPGLLNKLLKQVGLK